jgi:hypothetical protein
MTAAFAILRALDVYGDPNTCKVTRWFKACIMDFLNTAKYPPSLLFLLMTLGPPQFCVQWQIDQALSKAVMFGRVLFRLLRRALLCIHALIVLIGVLQGFEANCS